jgi:hypothetical protein
MQQNAVMQDLQVQQMLRNSQHQQYENLANTYLSTVPELRQKTLAKGITSRSRPFWQVRRKQLTERVAFAHWTASVGACFAFYAPPSAAP